VQRKDFLGISIFLPYILIYMHIINIGNELLFGKTINTNAAFIAEKLTDTGIEVTKSIVIADKPAIILQTVTDSFKETDWIITTGGLGPTKDDMTKEVIAQYFEMGFELHQPTLETVIKMFSERGLEVSEINRKQAMIPVGATVLPNRNGTAPGLWLEKNGKTLIALQGVPFEMQAILTESVIPMLKQKYKNTHVVVHKNILTSGAGESVLAQKIEKWENALPEEITLAYLPAPGQVLLRLTTRANDETIAQQLIETQLPDLLKIIQPYLVSIENESLVGVIAKILKNNNKKLAVAESCTGGYISHLITSLSGSSQFFEGAIVSYSNETKHDILNVRETNLKRYGAVSEMVVTDMALNAMSLFETDYAVATSGIAGPNGGSEEKPVGLVWIAVATPVKVVAQKFLFGKNGGREVIIKRAAMAALNMLRIELFNLSGSTSLPNLPFCRQTKP
jgi:nicotinamide-nucleotide amidase